jgi:hypothetical protein
MKEITIDGVVWVPKEMKEEAKKWEPKGGNYVVRSDGAVECTNGETLYSGREALFGTRYKTQELAEKAAKEMRHFNRLLAYKMEFCPEYEPDWREYQKKYYVVYDNLQKRWSVVFNCYSNSLVVYFTKKVAEELVKKLNSGEVTL